MIRRCAVSVLMLPAIALAACGTQDLDGIPGVFRFNNGAEPQTLDPALMTGSPEFTVAINLFEGLVTPHPETLEPLPGVAESWDISGDGLTYTFHLRRDARWSNGDPVTAHDFAYSWRRVLTPSTASLYAYQLYYVVNAENYHRRDDPDFEGAPVTDWSEVGIRADDDATLRIQLREPCPFFLHLCAFQTLMPVHQATVETCGERWTRAQHIVSNGPFRMASHIPQYLITLAKNPHYHDAARVRLEQVRIYAIEDVNTAFLKYECGGLDVGNVPLPMVDRALRRPDAVQYDQMITYFYRFNTTRPPFDDARVRRAFSLAVNKQEICDNVLRAGQEPAATFVPPSMHGYHAPEGLAYDPEEARRLLAEAGYPRGEGFPQVSLLFNTSESHRTIAEVIQSQWEKALNVRVLLTNQEWQTYMVNVNKFEYDISRAGWIGDYPDPNTFLDLFVTGGGNNRTGWGNSRYDALIQQAGRERDAAARMELFREAERLLCAEECPILPIYFYKGLALRRPYVRGYHYNLQTLHPLKYVWIDAGGERTARP